MKSIFLRYHGSFFASLIDNSNSAISIKREFPDDNHLYSFNSEVGAYVTYSTKRLPPWNITFQPKHIDAISSQFERYESSFLILICGFETTAVLDKSQVRILLPLENPTNSSISIKTGHDRKLSVSGTSGELKNKLIKTRTYEPILSALGISKSLT